MEKRGGLEASIAIAEAVGLCDADVVAAYPITPQTHIVEHLSELVADGELDVGRDHVPIELRIFVDDIGRRFVAQFLVHADFFEFAEQRVGFAQVMRVSELTNEIRRPHQ